MVHIHSRLELLRIDGNGAAGRTPLGAQNSPEFAILRRLEGLLDRSPGVCARFRLGADAVLCKAVPDNPVKTRRRRCE
jgi:hypothetical protein